MARDGLSLQQRGAKIRTVQAMPKKETGRDDWLSIPHCLGDWSNFQWRVFFCGVGYIMIVIAYAFSVPIPPLKTHSPRVQRKSQS